MRDSDQGREGRGQERDRRSAGVEEAEGSAAVPSGPSGCGDMAPMALTAPPREESGEASGSGCRPYCIL